MFDFDLAAIGFEYVGILHGHRFKLGDTGEIIYCFSMDTSSLLGQQLAKHTKRHFYRLLLQTRSRTESSLADGAKKNPQPHGGPSGFMNSQGLARRRRFNDE